MLFFFFFFKHISLKKKQYTFFFTDLTTACGSDFTLFYTKIFKKKETWNHEQIKAYSRSR